MKRDARCPEQWKGPAGVLPASQVKWCFVIPHSITSVSLLEGAVERLPCISSLFFNQSALFLQRSMTLPQEAAVFPKWQIGMFASFSVTLLKPFCFEKMDCFYKLHEPVFNLFFHHSSKTKQIPYVHVQIYRVMYFNSNASNYIRMYLMEKTNKNYAKIKCS